MSRAMLDFAIEEVNAGRAYEFSPETFTKAERELLERYVALRKAGMAIIWPMNCGMAEREGRLCL